MLRLTIWLCLAAVGAQASHFLSADDLVQQIVHNQTIVSVSPCNSTNTRFRLNLVNYFPADLMSKETRQAGGFILHLAIFLYLCLLLAVIIDSFFIRSLHYFTTELHISPNISGPTLMALGTSSPELFTCMMSVFMADNSTIGTGAIVGSSIVNTLAIPGICGLAVLFVEDCSALAKISCFPVMRDLLFYSITVIIFILSTKDNSVDCLESLIFIFIYLLYIFSLYVWSNIKAVNPQQPIRLIKRHRVLPSKHAISSTTLDPNGPSRTLRTLRHKPVSYLLEDNRCISYLLLPLLALARATIPRPNRHSFVLTFLGCCVWIASLTYLNLWMVSLIGEAFSLPEAISGMTILALGTNLPELLTSFILVRKYQLWDVAICHTIGSNIFDILICLGLPWFIQIFTLTIRTGSELSELGNYIIPLEHNLLYFVCLSLVLSILALNTILYFTNWRLNLLTGLLCLAAYGAYLATVLVLQVNSLL